MLLAREDSRDPLKKAVTLCLRSAMTDGPALGKSRVVRTDA